ncbi:MAG TPA: hypothetical protein VFG42_12150 [Baekduia sp.]|uniref:hypothetical protein n=1 Tax=Baekduia sp. TaxID=2600305 RepID=UPI002D791550|nr:hypothetical protein [Baekduia sp.]HET6507531.1 hypothetical protein [Baekduia sp.]
MIRRARARFGACDGQSSIELLGMLPLILLVLLSLAQLLATGAARSAASGAAEAAAAAVLQRTGDPADAARAAAPSWSRSRMAVTVDGRHVRVRVAPRAFLPGTARLLWATAEADAGPVPEARAPGTPTRHVVAAGAA